MRPVLALLLALPLLQGRAPTPEQNFQLIEVVRVPTAATPDPTRLPNAGETVLKISINGSARLVNIIRRHEMNGYAIIVRCDKRDASLFSDGPYVGSIKVSHGAPGFATFSPGAGSLRYDIYLPLTGRYRSVADFNAPMPGYDLGKQRLHLCIQLGGGAMSGLKTRTEEVRVTVGG